MEAEHTYAPHVSIYIFMYVMGHMDPIATHRALADSTNTFILFPSLAEHDGGPLLLEYVYMYIYIYVVGASHSGSGA